MHFPSSNFSFQSSVNEMLYELAVNDGAANPAFNAASRCSGSQMMDKSDRAWQSLTDAGLKGPLI